jgi:RNA polymerase sigma-70 factor (ECF subfamily)
MRAWANAQEVPEATQGGVAVQFGEAGVEGDVAHGDGQQRHVPEPGNGVVIAALATGSLQGGGPENHGPRWSNQQKVSSHLLQRETLGTAHRALGRRIFLLPHAGLRRGFDVFFFMVRAMDDNHWHPERYREYLRLLARLRWPARWRAKLDPSDLVHDTLVRAHQHQGDFQNQPEPVRMAYLRRILATTMVDAARHLGAGKRDATLERSLAADLEQSSLRLAAWLAAEQSTPSAQAQKREMLVHLAEQLAKLPDDERTALELRHLTEPPVPLKEIAALLGRPGAKAVAGLLHRGLARLRKLMSPNP